MKLTIALDVDDVVLNLVENWIRIYNRDFNGNADIKKLKEWDIGSLVKSEHRDAMYDYANHGEIFATADPVPNALTGVHLLKKYDHRIIYVTANNPENAKFDWLIKNGFLEDRDDFVVAYDKSLIIADYLVDDKYENAVGFKGVGIMFNTPWNAHYRFIHRVENWSDIIRQFKNGELFT